MFALTKCWFESLFLFENENRSRTIFFDFGEQKQNKTKKYFENREWEQNKNQTNKGVLSSIRSYKYLDSYTFLITDFEQIKIIWLRKLLRLY